MGARSLFAGWVLVWAGAAAAAPVVPPTGARPSGSDLRAEDQVLIPTGPRSGSGGPALVAEGRVERLAWRLPDSDLTPFQLINRIERQLEAADYSIRFACADLECGGFDFRLALDLLDAPAMHVDLGDFRYLAAVRDSEAGQDVVAVVTSRSGSGGHIHVTAISPAGSDSEPVAAPSPEGPTEAAPPPVETRAVPDTPPEGVDLITQLERDGRVVLADLAFRPGSAELGEGPFPSLAALASWLAADPARRLVLVGHSDNVGGLDANIRLSERRAASAAGTLRREFGIAAQRLAARGVGYLVPLVSNDSEEGRSTNRRVEAVITQR
ncbi:MAG: OmpA family protein [Pseudomonadota bacterium]